MNSVSFFQDKEQYLLPNHIQWARNTAYCQHSHGATGQPNTPKQFAEPARVRVTAQAS